MTTTHIKEIVELAKAGTIRELTGARVMQAIDAIRQRGNLKIKDPGEREPLSACTCNAYLRSVKSFTRWLWKEGRTASDALVGLSGFNTEIDRRHQRRELSVDEIRLLLAFVESYTDQNHKLAGPDRAMLYRIALSTGFRASELREPNARIVRPRRQAGDGDLRRPIQQAAANRRPALARRFRGHAPRLAQRQAAAASAVRRAWRTIPLGCCETT